jgi:hypothetical protein
MNIHDAERDMGLSGAVVTGAHQATGLLALDDHAMAWVEDFVDLVEDIGLAWTGEHSLRPAVEIPPTVYRDANELGDLGMIAGFHRSQLECGHRVPPRYAERSRS